MRRWDATIEELTDAYNVSAAVTISDATMGRELRAMKLTRKKRRWAVERDTPHLQARRDAFIAWIQTVDPNQLVFLDESGSNIAMTRDYARSPAGERTHDTVPRNRGTVTTMLGAITLKGMTAMMTVEGGTTSEVFETFVEELLVPTLERGDYVILDNLGAHKSSRALDAIRAAGAKPVFLPPYSPELNPIELAWAKLKRVLREAKARTREALDKAISLALDLISVEDALGWFRPCGPRSAFNRSLLSAMSSDNRN
jgi:transposase